MSQQHVNYFGHDGKVHELWYSDDGGWRHNVLSDLAPGADEGGDFGSLPNLGVTGINSTATIPDGYATPWNGQQHVNYIGWDSKIHELWYSDRAGWRHNSLSDLANANLNEEQDFGGISIHGYATAWNQQQHVNYVTNETSESGVIGKVHELWYSDVGGWRHNVLSDLAPGANDPASQPEVNTGLDGYVTAWNQQQHVNYVGNDGKVHELWYSDESGWRHNILNDLAPDADGKDSIPIPNSVVDGYATPWNKQQHVNYIGVDGKVHELWYSDEAGWRHNALSDLAGTSDQNSLPAQTLDGYATPWNEQQHVNYIGVDGKVRELWYSDGTGWRHNALSDLAGANDLNSLPNNPAMPVAYATDWNQQQHVIYVGADSKIHELWYSDGGRWRDNVLNDLAPGADNPNNLPWLSILAMMIDGYVS